MQCISIFTRPAFLGLLAIFAAAFLAPAATAQDLPDSHRLKGIPAGAMELAPAIKAAKPGETITVRGRVANTEDAFTTGQAEFVLIDDAAAARVMKESEGRVTPTTALQTDSRAVVQLVDSAGKPLTYSVKGRSGLIPDAEVFVTGTIATAATADSPMTINASGVFVPRGGLPAGFLLENAPGSAPDVADAKKGLKKGDTVVLKGRIGGSKDPFVKDRAVFTVVGRALKACNEIPGDTCKYPWDYCCDPRDQILANSATIQVTDAKGMPLRTDIKGRWEIKELSEVVIVGTVAESRGAALIVNATGLYVTAP